MTFCPLKILKEIVASLAGLISENFFLKNAKPHIFNSSFSVLNHSFMFL